MQARRFIGWILLFGIAAASDLASAQDYPTRPIRLVTAAVGGGIDFTARMLAAGLTERLHEQVVVDNRGGTNVAPQTVAKATPDGYTFLVHNNTVWIAPLLDQVPYDYQKELWPITLTARSPNILVVHPSLQVASVQELIARAKANPGKIQLRVRARRRFESHCCGTVQGDGRRRSRTHRLQRWGPGTERCPR